MKAMVEGVWRTDAEPTPASAPPPNARAFAPGSARMGASRPQPGRYHLYVSLRLPVRASHAARGARCSGWRGRFRFRCSTPTGRAGRAGCSTPPAATPDHVNGLRLPCRRSIARPTRRLPARSPCRPFGTKSPRPSSTTNWPRSCACSRSSSARSRTTGLDLYPEPLRAEIDTDQRARRAVRQRRGLSRGLRVDPGGLRRRGVELFAALEGSSRASRAHRFLVGERLTEADLRLFPTLVRFDVAYYGALRCNLRRLATTRTCLAYARRICRSRASPRRSGSITSSGTTGTITR